MKLGPYTQRRGLIQIDKKFFDALEEYILWSEGVPARHEKAMDVLVRFMALTNQGIAQRMSAGPYDPHQRRPELAWRVPVRRISERYYLGWKVKRLRPNVWMLYNDSREAYFIEFGISRVGWGVDRDVPVNRIRRPIRKLSLLRTLDALMRTRVYHRVWADIYRNPRSGRAARAGFTQIVQAPGGAHSIGRVGGISIPNQGGGSYTGPGLGRNLP